MELFVLQAMNLFRRDEDNALRDANGTVLACVDCLLETKYRKFSLSTCAANNCDIYFRPNLDSLRQYSTLGILRSYYGEDFDTLDGTRNLNENTSGSEKY